jgi:hypothetical protein
MPARRFAALCVVLVAAVAGVAAAGSVVVRSVTFSTSIDATETRPVDVVERFTSDAAAVHAVAVLDGVASEVRVQGTWISIDAIKVPNYEIGSAELLVRPKAGQDPVAHFTLSRPQNGWPLGRYALRIAVGGEVVKTSEFSVVAAPDGAVAGRASPKGKLFRHPAGFSFRVPEQWSAAVEGDVVKLTPPGASQDADAPEFYLVVSENVAAEKISRSDDPRIAKSLDEQIVGLAPSMQRQSGTESIGTRCGPATILSWEAKGEDEQVMRARAFVAIVGEHCVSVVGFAAGDVLAKRDRGLRDLVATIGAEDDKADAAPAPVAPPVASAGDAGLREKLAALDRARDAGVLSDEEYARKRAALVPAAPALDEATRAKIEALDAARAAGVLDEREYAAKRAALVGATAAPAAGGAKADPTLRRDVPAQQGKVYRHPIGFSMWYPASWTLQEVQGVPSLTPPDAAKGADGPHEAYFVTGESVASSGLTDPADPRLISAVDQQAAQLAPFLARKGEPRAAAMDQGRGVVVDYEGANPRGDLILARARITIVRETAISLLAIGHKAAVTSRDADCDRIFASFQLGEGRIDEQIVGAWAFLATRELRNDSAYETAATRASSVSDTSTSMTLSADGTWTRTSRHHMIAGAGGTWIESDDVKTDRGRWFALEGRMTLLEEKGAMESYRYELRGGELVVEAGGKAEVWGRR